VLLKLDWERSDFSKATTKPLNFSSVSITTLLKKLLVAICAHLLVTSFLGLIITLGVRYRKKKRSCDFQKQFAGYSSHPRRQGLSAVACLFSTRFSV
jgi:hypothetical protein